jgi:hypothetical protein
MQLNDFDLNRHSESFPHYRFQYWDSGNGILELGHQWIHNASVFHDKSIDQCLRKATAKRLHLLISIKRVVERTLNVNMHLKI